MLRSYFQEKYSAYTSLVMSAFREKKLLANERLGAVVFRDTMEIPNGNAISCIPFIVLFPSNIVRTLLGHPRPSNENNILLRHHGGEPLSLCNISSNDGTPSLSFSRKLPSSLFTEARVSRLLNGCW